MECISHPNPALYRYHRVVFHLIPQGFLNFVKATKLFYFTRNTPGCKYPDVHARPVHILKRLLVEPPAPGQLQAQQGEEEDGEQEEHAGDPGGGCVAYTALPSLSTYGILRISDV